MTLFDPNVTPPLNDAVPVPVIAPSPPTPIPFNVTVSAPIATPAISSVAPLATTVPPVVEPSAFACWADRVPALMVVTPLYVLFAVDAGQRSRPVLGQAAGAAEHA